MRHTRTQANEEIERFKRDVNLSELAASLGYRLVLREQSGRLNSRGSTASSISMRHPDTNDKIIIRRDRDQHWIYFSVRSDTDNGTVIDFLQQRGVRGLGEIRKQLRAWLHEDRPKVPVELYRRSIAAQDRNEAGAAEEYRRARAAPSRYLTDRAIAVNVQLDSRFFGRYRLDSGGNVLFPHVDPASGRVVGFEIKNRGFTGFATGGRKTYWTSATLVDDVRFVIVETAIDAFSYHHLFPHARSRYISTGGAVGPDALTLIGRAIAAMPADADLVSATDNDKGGEKLHSQLVEAGGRPLRRHVSPIPKDWNDYLQSLHREGGRKPENSPER